VADVPEPFPLPVSLHWETADVAWVDEGQLAALELFPAFRAALGHLGVL